MKKTRVNPIKDNRVVEDYTYATRYLSFLSRLFPIVPCLSLVDSEEFEYLCYTAVNLVRYQVETCPENEKWYFENLVKGYKDAWDIIEKHICSSRPDFLEYLKGIKALYEDN